MCPYKIGTLIWVMLMTSIDFFTKLKVVWIGMPLLRQLTQNEVKLHNKPWITSTSDISKMIKIKNKISTSDISKMIKIKNKIFGRKKATTL